MWETVEVVLSPAMKVAVDMKSIELNLGNTGIVLYVYDNANKYVGKLRVGQATVE